MNLVKFKREYSPHEIKNISKSSKNIQPKQKPSFTHRNMPSLQYQQQSKHFNSPEGESKNNKNSDLLFCSFADALMKVQFQQKQKNGCKFKEVKMKNKKIKLQNKELKIAKNTNASNAVQNYVTTFKKSIFLAKNNVQNNEEKIKATPRQVTPQKTTDRRGEVYAPLPNKKLKNRGKQSFKNALSEIHKSKERTTMNESIKLECTQRLSSIKKQLTTKNLSNLDSTNTYEYNRLIRNQTDLLSRQLSSESDVLLFQQQTDQLNKQSYGKAIAKIKQKLNHITIDKPDLNQQNLTQIIQPKSSVLREFNKLKLMMSQLESQTSFTQTNRTFHEQQPNIEHLQQILIAKHTQETWLMKKSILEMRLQSLTEFLSNRFPVEQQANAFTFIDVQIKSIERELDYLIKNQTESKREKSCLTQLNYIKNMQDNLHLLLKSMELK